MARRLPSQPPVLPGFSHVRVLGAGGFADVFLYEQNMPRRQVAVKVMLSEVVNDQVRMMFQAEANLMAQLSSHPAILTVYQASVSSDGRPYIVMELCSAALSARYRTEQLPVAEVLRVGVKIGSAIETAHRAGVLHRDIKPSNILLTAYGHPVLADFGIAATLSDTQGQEAVGMSVPWSAPEVLMDETAGTVASEVWSLAATVYSLLAGRSPFEIPGGANGSSDLISRITRAKPQPIGRADVPATLERALAAAMSRRPENRPASILELVRALQAIETELGVPQTPIDVAMDDWALATVSDLEDRTRVRGVEGALAAPTSRRRRRRAAETPYTGVGTIVREGHTGGLASGTRPAAQGRRLQALGWGMIASSILVLVLAVTAIYVIVRVNDDGTPVVSNITATVSGETVLFSWADPGITRNDSYHIVTSEGDRSVQRTNDFVMNAEPGERVCITVSVSRDGRTGNPSGEKCADVGG